MGERGPTPKRSTQRRRTNSPEVPVDSAEGAAEVTIPEPDPKWHPIALELYRSMMVSGQRVYFEPSDWAAAQLLCESISRELRPQTVLDSAGKIHRITQAPRGAAMASWRAQMASLLVTETDRRRVSIELFRPKPSEGGGNVSSITDARRRFGEPS